MLFRRDLTLSALSVVVCVNVAAQTQSPATSGGQSSRYVAIGCVSREAQASTGRGATPRVRFILSDPRGDRPTVYQLDGNAASLEFHIGHTVEISGPLTVAPSAGRGQGALVLKVVSLTYISTTCQKPK